MNQPDLAKTALDDCIEVGVDHLEDFARREVVQIDRVLDWKDDGFRLAIEFILVVGFSHGESLNLQ